MRTELILALISFVTLQACVVAIEPYIGRVNGKTIAVSLPTELLAKSPEWRPGNNETPEPPVSIGNAIQKATAAVLTTYPETKDKNLTIDVRFRAQSVAVNAEDHFIDDTGIEYRDENAELHLVPNRWVYWIRLKHVPVAGNGLTHVFSPDIPVAVLMNGEVLTPRECQKLTGDKIGRFVPIRKRP